MSNSPTAPILLEAAGLEKSFQLGHRSVTVLRGVNLTIRRGDFLALRGASGAGKSTLLHLLGGLDEPSAGRVVIDGINLGSMPPRELARVRNRRFGFVFQAYHLLPELDALENVCVPARLARMAIEEATQRGRTLLERVGLGHRMDHQPNELSGGEQQRVAIARALMNEPELLFADEPTGNLDSHTGEEIISLLCELQAERQATLVIATHDARVAARAPRVVELVDGQIATSEAAAATPAIY